MSDKEWESIQQRTFTKWVNAQIKKRGLAINDLTVDLADGIVLINLYEVISDESLGNYNKQPKMKIQQIQNLKIVVTEINKFVGSVGIKLQYSPDEVNKGEKKSILGMIWCLIHKFEIQDITEDQMSAREGLLLWCKKKTKGYKNVNVQNFNTSWQDGLAFCALIHKHRPDLLDFDSLDPSKARDNLKLAFDVAEKSLDIPPLLDVEDIVNSAKPDDKSVMTYVAYYWKKFASSNKMEKSGRKLARVAKARRDNERMQSDYEERAKKLLAWIGEHDKIYSNTDPKSFGRNVKEVQDKNADFKRFKNHEKPEQTKEKADLAMLLINLQSKQKNERMPVYVPPEELSTESINNHWGHLNETQAAYDQAIREALARMKYLEMLLDRYRARAKKVLTWQQEKESFLTEPVNKELPIGTLRAKLNLLKAFDEEFTAVNKTQDSTIAIGQEVIDGGHSAGDEIMETNISMKTGRDSVQQQKGQKLQNLEEMLKFKLEIEQLCIDFAKKVDQLNLFLEEAGLSVSEPVRASSVKDVEAANSVMEGLMKAHKEAVALLKEIQDIHKKVTEAGEDPQIYSAITLEDITKKYNEINKDLNEKKGHLSNEKTKQESNHKLISEYNAACVKYVGWATKTLKEIQEETKGSLEEQLAVLQKLGEKSVKESHDTLSKLVKEANHLEELDIAELVDHTVQEMQATDEQIKSAFSKRSKAIEGQIISKKMGSVTKEQLDEFHETFKHFDKAGKNHLGKNDFKAACAAVGEDIPDSELDAVFRKYDKDNDGLISFEEFTEYMSGLVKEGTGYEDVIASFKELAGGADVISQQQLLSNMEKEEAEYLIQTMPKKGDGYDYVAYANETFGKK
jgi:actinin alpha